MKPSDKPNPQQRTTMINWLTARGLRPNVVSTIVSAGKTRAEMTAELVKVLRVLPKVKRK